MKGSITGYIDVAQVVLYVFWAFLAGLIYYLHRESKREGYPLQSVTRPGKFLAGFLGMPGTKTFMLPHGGTHTVPRQETDMRELKAKPSAGWPGAPLVPSGNPMIDGVGPAAWAERSDAPDLTIDGHPRIVPMNTASGYGIAGRDPDPRGMSVLGADKKIAGVVKDVWVDRSEAVIRYLEVELANGARRVLLPITLARININGQQRNVTVKSILASQFAQVPATKLPAQVTRREEDQICGYYGGGHLYAIPSRQEPLL